MKDLSSVTVVGSGHVLTASIFFGSVAIPFSDTTWPKYSTSLANSRHFLGLSFKCQVSFDQLKNCLVRSPVLAHPDFSQPFILDTDASNSCIGAVLSQVQNGQEKAIAFASRSMTKSERKYCVTRKVDVTVALLCIQ
jgi:hypothetical protein